MDGLGNGNVETSVTCELLKTSGLACQTLANRLRVSLGGVGKEKLLESTTENMLPIINSLFGELTLLGARQRRTS